MDNNTEKKTTIQTEKSGFSDINGCLTMFLLIMLCAVAGNVLKISKVRLESENMKLERIKKEGIMSHANDGTLVNSTDTLKFDTLKIGNYQKTYIPLLKQYKSQQQKGR